MGLEDGNTIASYINSLSVLTETQKKELIQSAPKSLEEVSFWLKEHGLDKPKTPDSNNPFAALADSGKNRMPVNQNKFSNVLFMKNAQMPGIHTPFSSNEWVEASKYDDYSLGLSIQKCSASEDIKPVLYSAQTSAPAQTKTSKTVETPDDEKQVEEAKKEASVRSIQNGVKTALGEVYARKAKEGDVSKTWDNMKEFFGSDLASSSVARNLYAEAKSAELMERARTGNLTVKEYHEAKVEMAMDLLPTEGLSEDEKRLLKEKLSSLTNEKLAVFIDKIRYAKGSEYDDLKNTVKKMVAEAIAAKSPDSNGGGVPVEAYVEDAHNDNPLTFEKVFFLERGVPYNSENIDDYNQKAAMYALSANIVQRSENVHSYLDEALKQVKFNSQGAENPEVIKNSENNLKNGIILALKELYGDDEAKIQQALKELLGDDSIKYQDGKLVSDLPAGVNAYSLTLIAEKILKNTDENTAKILDGKTVDDFKKEMTDSYRFAYGEKNARQLARAFEEDQKKGVQYIKTAAAIASGAVAAGSMLMFPYCTPLVGKAVIAAGSLIGVAGSSSVDIIENSTKEGGMTEEDKEAIKEELLQNAALFVVSYGAGVAGGSAKAALLAKNCPKLVALAADIGLDSTISLIGDLAITGQIDLTAEGVSQLIAQLTGVMAQKAAAKLAVKNAPHGETNIPKENIAGIEKDGVKYEHGMGRKNLKGTKFEDIMSLNPQEFKKRLNEKYPDPKAMFDDAELLESLARDLTPEMRAKLKECVTPENIDDILGFLQNQKISDDMLSDVCKLAKEQPETVQPLNLLYNTQGTLSPSYCLEIQDLMAKYPDKAQQIIKDSDAVLNFKRNSYDSDYLGQDDAAFIKYVTENPELKNEAYLLMSSNRNFKIIAGTERNDFAAIQRLRNENPQYSKRIMALAVETGRPYSEIEAIINSLTPGNDKEVLKMALNNPNLRIDANRQDFRIINQLKKTYPYLGDDIVKLACNKNMDVIGVQKLTNLMANHPEFRNDIMRLSQEKILDYDNIFKTLQDFQVHPEFREIMFNPEKTEFDFISKQAPDADVKQKRESILNQVSNVVDPKQMNRLKNALGDKIYNINWEKMISENASPQEIKKVFTDLYERTKFFARLDFLEKKFGKNGRWASEMNEISDKAVVRIKDGESFDDVLSSIANDVHNDVRAHRRPNDTGANNANDEAGVSRNNPETKDVQYMTPYGENNYGEYKERFDKIKSKRPPRKSPYPDMEVTNIVPEAGLMIHPSAAASYDAGMRHINDRYKELGPLIQKVNSGQPLSKSELKQAKAKIAEIHYLMTNIMPYRRGSAGIADTLTRSLCKSLGIDLPPLKKGVALDLEAFHLNLDEYIKQWDSFFEA